MKTPEELAEEYAKYHYDVHNDRVLAKMDFLAGYQAAKDEYKVAIDAYNDVAKQMLHEAVRIMTPTHEIAEDVLGACNVPEKPDGWISVKDRLPEFCEDVLVRGECGIIDQGHRIKYHNRDTWIWKAGNYSGCAEEVTHWMPLPAAPKEEA
jgi:hypothetical protein